LTIWPGVWFIGAQGSVDLGLQRHAENSCPTCRLQSADAAARIEPLTKSQQQQIAFPPATKDGFNEVRK